MSVSTVVFYSALIAALIAGPSSNAVGLDCTEGEDAQVTDVYRKQANVLAEIDRNVKLGDAITIKINCLTEYINKKTKEPKKNVLLFIDGRPLVGSTAYPPSDPRNGELNFELRRTEKSRDVWNYLLGHPFSNNGKRSIAVSAGVEDDFQIPIAPGVQPLILDTVPGWSLTFWIVIMLLLLVLFLVMAKRSDLLRDAGPQPAGRGERRPFSLARVQAAWWLFLILGSYLFVGIITGDYATSVTGTAVMLLGLAAATAAGAAAIEASKPGEIDKMADTLKEKKSELAVVDAAVPKNQATVDNLRSTIEALEKELAAAQPKADNFLQDILSDANGVTFHRFQVLAWAVVLGIIFVWGVYTHIQWWFVVVLLAGVAMQFFWLMARGLGPPEASPEVAFVLHLGTSGAALVVGGVLGFLFGIPRTPDPATIALEFIQPNTQGQASHVPLTYLDIVKAILDGRQPSPVKRLLTHSLHRRRRHVVDRTSGPVPLPSTRRAERLLLGLTLPV